MFIEKENFFNWLKLRGIREKSLNYKDLNFLVQTQKDLDDFLKMFHGVSDLFFDVSRFRLKKLKENYMTYEEFIYAYQLDKKGALEWLFQHPVLEREVKFLGNRLKNQKISLQQLYHKHYESLGYRMMSFLL